MALRRFYKLLMFLALARAGVAIAAATTEEVYTHAAEEMLGWVKPRDIVTIYEAIGRPDLAVGGAGQVSTSAKRGLEYNRAKVLSDVYRMPAAGDDGADTYGKSTSLGSIVQRESLGVGQHHNRGHQDAVPPLSGYLSIANL